MILTSMGYRVRLNEVKLWYAYQHPKSSLTELIFGTHMYISMYFYFDPGGLGFPPDELHLFAFRVPELRLFEL
jgi:hypothetical protein